MSGHRLEKGAPPSGGQASDDRVGVVADPEHAYRRLQHLYEISKLLTRFDSVEQTIQQIISLVSQTLPLRSAILILNRGGQEHSSVWVPEDVSPGAFAEVLAHARSSYAYLARTDTPLTELVDGERTRHYPLPGPRAESGEPQADARQRLAVLPLVVDHGSIFGALQWETVDRLQERDLGFVNAVVNQIAIALARQASLEAVQLAQEKIRDQLEFITAITGSLGEGVVAMDSTGRITFFNPAAEQLLGWTVQEAIGEHVQTVIPLKREDRAPIAEGEEPLMRPVRTGEPCRTDEHLITRRDRTVFPVSLSSCPLRQDGKISGTVLIIQDILEARRAAKAHRFLSEVSAALACSLEYNHTLSTLARLAVPILADLCFVDVLEEDGQILNHEMAFADPNSQTIAERLRRYESGAGRPSPWKRAMRSGRVVLLHDKVGPGEDLEDDREYAALMKGLGLNSMMVVPLLERERVVGALTFIASPGLYYVAADLTMAAEIARRATSAIENARLYQKARSAIRTREDILAVVSHDLRNPLSTIFLSADLLVRTLSSDESGERNRVLVRSISRSAKQMNDLIGDLLDFSSIEAGRLSIQAVRYSAERLLMDALESLEPSARHKTLQLKAQFPERDFFILCDRARILQVFSNLVGNAVKFTPMGGSIVLRADPGPDQACFSVSDTGPGIAPDQLPHIFNRFWQGRGTGRTGVGLGLSIARGIVEAHGGRIWVESQVSVGTNVYFTLPMDAGNELLKAQGSTAGPDPQAS